MPDSFDLGKDLDKVHNKLSVSGKSLHQVLLRITEIHKGEI